MALVDRIKQLAQEKTLTLAELERRLDFPNSSIRKWDNQNPGVNKIQKVADYFDVSVDYLLGRTENKYADLSKKPQFTVEEALASVMSSDGKPLTEHDRKVLTGIIEAYLEKNTDAE